MPPTPSQIREQLLKAIDQDAKVINMVCVLEAISCLENTQITKEALEETRLGKIVNDIRKNTDDSALSTRCKKLVRVWSKQFVRGTPGTSKPASGGTQDAATNKQPTPPTQGTASIASAGGNRTPSIKSQTSTTPTSTVDKRKSENRKRRKQSDFPSSATSTGSESTSTKKVKPAACTPTSNATKDQTDPETKNGMPAQRVAGKSNLQSSKSAFSKVRPSESKTSLRTSSPASKAKEVPSPGLSKLNANPSGALSKSPLTKQLSSPVNSRSSRLSPAVKASKLSPSLRVKQQRESNSRESSRLQADVTVSGKGDETAKDKVTPRQPQGKSPSVQESLEDSNSSSATVKLRPSSPERCTTPATATRSTDTSTYDSTQPVLQSVDGPSLREQDCSKTSFSIFDDDYDEQDEIHSDEKYSRILDDFDKASPLPSLTVPADGDKPLGGSLFDNPSVETDGPDGRAVALTEDADQEAVLSELEEERMPSQPATEEDIAKVHHEQWEGVNGCYDSQKQWCDWTQSLSISLEDDHALHILPYVCLD